MTDALEIAFSITLIVTLWATGVGGGLSHTATEVVAAAANGRRFARLIALDAVVLPVVVYALARFLDVPEGYAAGLVIVGAASAGAIGLAVVRLAGADMPLAIGLLVVLEAGNLITIPLWSTILLPEQVRPPVADILGTLILGVLLPLIVGAGLRAALPGKAQIWARTLSIVSTIGFIVAVAIIVWLDAGVLIDAWAALVPIVALATAIIALGAGWLAGGPLRTSRATGALILTVRANTPALAVAGSTYGATSDAAAAIVVFALVAFIVAPVFAVGVRHVSA